MIAPTIALYQDYFRGVTGWAGLIELNAPEFDLNTCEAQKHN